jgi:hypothetical protein
MSHDLVDLMRVAQDGTRVRASAGASSFRKGTTLEALRQEALFTSGREALRYGMADLDRLERMVLRRIGRDFFVLPRRDDRNDRDNPEDEDDDR